jgi:hypothetical protein
MASPLITLLRNVHLKDEALATAEKLIAAGAVVQRMEGMRWYFQQQLPDTITRSGKLREHIGALDLPEGEVIYWPDGGMRFCYTPADPQINITAFFRTYQDPNRFFYGNVPKWNTVTMKIKDNR